MEWAAWPAVVRSIKAEEVPVVTEATAQVRAIAQALAAAWKQHAVRLRAPCRIQIGHMWERAGVHMPALQPTVMLVKVPGALTGR